MRWSNPDSPVWAPRQSPLAISNEDGHDDTAVGTIPGLQTRLSSADGTFQDAVLHEVGNGTTRKVATADLNDDGNVDIAVSRQAYGAAPKVSVLFGAGDGTFASPVDIEVGPVIADTWNTASPIPADVDNDGVPDLVVGTEQLSPLQYTSVVLLNTGDGTFTDPRSVKSADGVILGRSRTSTVTASPTWSASNPVRWPSSSPTVGVPSAAPGPIPEELIPWTWRSATSTVTAKWTW
jgi:hypothetical protein